MITKVHVGDVSNFIAQRGEDKCTTIEKYHN